MTLCRSFLLIDVSKLQKNFFAKNNSFSFIRKWSEDSKWIGFLWNKVLQEMKKKIYFLKLHKSFIVKPHIACNWFMNSFQFEVTQSRCHVCITEQPETKRIGRTLGKRERDSKYYHKSISIWFFLFCLFMFC